jgi:hypothetical protein
MAWQHILPQVTVKGFKKCCISNTVEGTDGDTPNYVIPESIKIKNSAITDFGTIYIAWDKWGTRKVTHQNHGKDREAWYKPVTVK